MTRRVDTRNAASAARIGELATRLSDDDLGVQIDGPWTAGSLFAHIAFWDRFLVSRWRDALGRGDHAPTPIDDAIADLLNDAGIPEWSSVPGREAIRLCIEAARGADSIIASLADDVVQELLDTGRERLVDRSLHRGEHLDTIESAFPGQRQLS